MSAGEYADADGCIDDARALVFADLLRGRLTRSVAIANPDAGADFVATVPVGAVWYVLSVTGIYSASAAVATRLPVLIATDGVSTLYQVPTAGSIAANGVSRFTWARDLGYSVAAGGTTGSINGLPATTLTAGCQIQSAVSGIQAADQWSALIVYVVELTVGNTYWNAELLRQELAAEIPTDYVPGTPVPISAGQSAVVAPIPR